MKVEHLGVAIYGGEQDLGVSVDGGEQMLHVGRPPCQLATAGGAAAHLGHSIFDTQMRFTQMRRVILINTE